uniref:ULP_PROTEASE domain-containing protein n=1 Tax=Rhabditophanes sp. KR3021 TaxID=114890 RepID=A0AC35TVQ1_9BILA
MTEKNVSIEVHLVAKNNAAAEVIEAPTPKCMWLDVSGVLVCGVPFDLARGLKLGQYAIMMDVYNGNAKDSKATSQIILPYNTMFKIKLLMNTENKGAGIIMSIKHELRDSIFHEFQLCDPFHQLNQQKIRDGKDDVIFTFSGASHQLCSQVDSFLEHEVNEKNSKEVFPKYAQISEAEFSSLCNYYGIKTKLCVQYGNFNQTLVKCTHIALYRNNEKEYSCPEVPVFHVNRKRKHSTLIYPVNKKVTTKKLFTANLHQQAVFPNRSEPTILPVSFHSLNCLVEKEMMNDEIMDFYLERIKKDYQGSSNKMKIHIENTFFYTRLVQDLVLDSAQRLTTRQKELFIARMDRIINWARFKPSSGYLFDNEMIIVPINTECHWIVAVIYRPGTLVRDEPDEDKPDLSGDYCDVGCVMVYDSYINAESTDPYRTKIISILKYFMCHYFKSGQKHGHFEGKHLSRQRMMLQHLCSPIQQKNEYDCGFYSCEFIRQILRRPERMHKLIFSHLTMLKIFPAFIVKGKREYIFMLARKFMTQEDIEKQAEMENFFRLTNKKGPREQPARVRSESPPPQKKEKLMREYRYKSV